MDPQLALALGDAGAPARRWPGTWPDTLFYASGTNDAGEIRGFAALGIPVGFSAAQVGPAALAELDRLHVTGTPLFGDTGAYGEVSPDPARKPGVGAATGAGSLAVVRPISADEWEARLAVYARVAARYADRFAAVAPDRVGDQEETLERLIAFRDAIRSVAGRGTRILLPLHRGPRRLDAFFTEARRAVGVFGAVPAFPMPRGGTTPADVIDFVRTARPGRIHLLGLGLRSRVARDLLPLLALRWPGVKVSMDANLITSAVGRRADGSPSRRLTAAQDAIRRRGFPQALGAVADPSWGIAADFTDAAAYPGEWLGPAGLRAVAAEASLSAVEAARWRRDPDAFLQDRVHDAPDSPKWWEHPAMQHALEAAWCRHLHRIHTNPRKEQAIRTAFADHPAAGQFPAPRLPALAADEVPLAA